MCRLPKMAFEIISNTANRLNYLFSQHLRTLVTDEKQVIVGKLVEIMESRLKRPTRRIVGGLHALFHLHDKVRARRFTELGLGKDPDNDHLQRLEKRLSQGSEPEIVVNPVK